MGVFHASANCKNGRFSVIPAGTRSVANVGHFLVAQTVPPNFVDHGPNLRIEDWPKAFSNFQMLRRVTQADLSTAVITGAATRVWSLRSSLYAILLAYSKVPNRD